MCSVSPNGNLSFIPVYITVVTTPYSPSYDLRSVLSLLASRLKG